jgi:hypothetical protein
MLSKLVGNEDESSEGETTGNESTGVPAMSTGVPQEPIGNESTGVPAEITDTTGVQEYESIGVSNDEDITEAPNETADEEPLNDDAVNEAVTAGVDNDNDDDDDTSKK